MFQTWSNLFKLDQTWSNLFKLDQICLNLIKLDQTCSNLFKLDQTWSNLFKLVQTWPNWIKMHQCDSNWSWQTWSWLSLANHNIDKYGLGLGKHGLTIKNGLYFWKKHYIWYQLHKIVWSCFSNFYWNRQLSFNVAYQVLSSWMNISDNVRCISEFALKSI